MRLLRRSRPDAAGDRDLDEATADRLLAGALVPDDAPPGLAAVATVLTAAAGPVDPTELGGEAEARAAFRRARPAGAPAPSPGRRHRRGARVAVLVAGAMTVGATAAAAGTGNLPGPAQDALSNLLDRVGVSVPSAGEPAVTAGVSGAAVGPDATGPAGYGLCTAFAGGEGGDSVAFRALLAVVDEGAMGEFCATVTPGNPDAPGGAATPPGLDGSPPPGQGGPPPGLGGNPPPGQGGDNPGQGGSPPGGTAPGQGGAPPGLEGSTSTGQGGPPPGLGGNPPPGQGGDNPSPGNESGGQGQRSQP